MIKDVVSLQLPVGEHLLIRKNTVMPPKKPRGRLKRICVVTGIHGDELEGQYVCYELQRRIQESPADLNAQLDVYPAINPLGIDCLQRGMPLFDLDLNRTFPGRNDGAAAEWMASKVIEDLEGADLVLDIHASNIFLREIPQVRINVNNRDKLVPLAKYLDVDFVWVHQAATVLESTLAYSLNELNTKTLVIEAGVGMRITEDYCVRLVNGILNLMKSQKMWSGHVDPVRDPIVSRDQEVSFLNAEKAGLFMPSNTHSSMLKKGDEVGRILDPLRGEVLEVITSPVDGLLFTLREYPIVNEGSLIARILKEGGK